MRYLVIFIFSCSSPHIEPRFCVTCHEQNYAESKYGIIVGDGFVDYCNKTNSEIDSLENDYVKIIDTVKFTHTVKCVKKNG